MNRPTPPQPDSPLAMAGYVLDAQGRVWGRPGQPSFAYSDGDEVEQRIGHAIASSNDVSLFSEELRSHQTDWPSIYHLSAARANLLRPIGALFAGKRVLEIGAGCGAITRYLGEQGADVLALEGSPRRAGIAAERCRDLPNVTVLAERFDAFDASAKFDVVTLVGVLEYARMYTAGEDPVQETLRKAHSLLADDGVLLVAIENQLGLKYFAGVHEDHLSRAMAGIQDHYDAHGVVTFGKIELERRMAAAGFIASELALPFPDYKLPQSLLLPAGYASGSGLDSAAIASQAVRSDRQLPRSVLFSMAQAFGVLGRNDLIADLSNSFLLLARKSDLSPAFDRLAPNTLAEHYATDRHPAFVKVSRFVRQGDVIRVQRERLCMEASPPTSALLSHSLDDEDFIAGKHSLLVLESIVSRPQWTLDQLCEWFIEWRNAFAEVIPEKQTNVLGIDTPIAGTLIDAVPRNLIISSDGPKFFDYEWNISAPLTFGYLAFRAVTVSLASVSSIASPAKAEMLHVPTLLRAVFRRVGMILTGSHIQSYLDFDEALRSEVSGTIGRPLSLSDFEGYVLTAAPSVDALLRTSGESSIGESLADVAARLTLLQSEHEAIQLQLTNKVLHTEDLERRVGEVMLEAEQVRATSLEQAQAHRREIDGKRQQIDLRELRLGEVMLEADRARGLAFEQAQAHQREIDGKCQQIDVLERRLGEAALRGDQAQTALDSLREQALHHHAQLAELAAALSLGASKIASLREELLTAEQRLEAGTQQSMALEETIRRSVEREQSIASELETTRKQLDARTLEVQELERAVARLQQTVGDIERVEATAREKDNEIHRLWLVIDELQLTSDQFATLHSGARDRIEALERELRDARQFEPVAACLEDELNRVKHSRSWKLTAPVRAVNAALHGASRGLRSMIGRAVERTYRALPMSPARKRGVKGAIFRVSGGLLSRTNAYRRWHADLRTHAAEPPMRSLDSPAPENAPAFSGEGDVTTLVNTLWEADGVREWADYSPTRQRIDAAVTQLRDSKEAKPVRVLDFSDRALADVARTLELPCPPELPDVTILIPVFNHLTTTLECIASIAAFYDPNGPTFEVLVANDGSTDDTASVLSQVSNLRIVTHPVNMGFLRNCNAVAPHARGRYLLLLNNDVQVTEGWLGPLVSCLENDASVAAVGPKIVYPSGWLQEAGTSLRRDGTSEMVGLNDLPDLPRFSYTRDVDYCSGACLLLRTEDFRALGGFDEAYAPAYCEDSDLCMRLRAQGRRIRFCAETTVVHHLSKTSNDLPSEYKLACISRNLATFSSRWRGELDAMDDVRTIAFYLPQFHPMAENDLWWGQGFTEWTNVTKARPNYLGHYQPRVPADLGYYDLRLTEVMEQQAALARRYGVGGFCYYYYWFAGKRLLERPIEQMLATGRPDFPFCLCWANENWTRRWDGQEQDVLMAQKHSDEDDLAAIRDLMRYFRSPNYIRIDGRPLILVYRITLFPDFARTAALWRQVCRDEGIGDIYIAQVESFELVSAGIHPHQLGCDAAVEFPPQGMADPYPVSAPLLNPQFEGAVADYRDLAVRYATRDLPAYKRFMGVMPGWDNTARRQNNSYSFEHATPGAFQAWLETTIARTKQQYSGDERLVFINAWNEWAEGAYLEPDRRFGHSFLQAHANALDSSHLVRNGRYSL